MRVLVTGMGGDVGTRICNLLEADDRVEAVLGVDIDPPRLRLRRADFVRVDPRDRRRLVRTIRDFEPSAVIHFGVYEPNARVGPALARVLTRACTVTALGAAAESRSLQQVVVRSGIEVYGRARGAATRPDESVTAAPTSPYGRSLLEVETLTHAAMAGLSVPVAVLRCAPIVGPHLASPLGRLLRLPVVPVSAVADLPFSVVHNDDAARAFVDALWRDVDGAVNVVAPGAVTAVQAARLGGRIPVPVLGPSWLLARVVTEGLGAPLPPHVRELLVRGRTADGSRAEVVLGRAPQLSTPDVVRALHEWATVSYLRTTEEAAA